MKGLAMDEDERAAFDAARDMTMTLSLMMRSILMMFLMEELR